jgi:hypothetical protein
MRQCVSCISYFALFALKSGVLSFPPQTVERELSRDEKEG